MIGNSYNDSTKPSTIVASAQDNTIFAGTQDVVNLNGGADLIVPNGNTKVMNYETNTNAGFLFSGLDDLIGAIESYELTLINNSISYKSAGAVMLTDNTSTNSSANVYSNARTKTKTVWTHKEGGSLDISESDEGAVLVGNYLGDKSGVGEIKGSTANDTILGGRNDIINLSEGNDTIILSESNEESGTVINLTKETETQSQSQVSQVDLKKIQIRYQ